MRVSARDVELECALRGFAWETVDSRTSVDATIEIEAVPQGGSMPTLVGLVHGHMVRRSAESPFEVPLTHAHLEELVRTVLDDSYPVESGQGSVLRIPEARWTMKACPIRETDAPQYAGRAREVLESRFDLKHDPRMQDWELEVCDPDRIEEYLAFYDQQVDPAIRFDTMAIALVAYDEARDPSAWAPWFERTLRRDFALHGHSIAYWAALDRDARDPELRRQPSESVFRISGTLREIWESSLRPIQLLAG